MLAEQLDSLFKQTVASHIAEVWVCAFDSPLSDYVVSTVEEAEHENVRVIVSDVNFKFYGRFQVRSLRCIHWLQSCVLWWLC